MMIGRLKILLKKITPEPWGFRHVPQDDDKVVGFDYYLFSEKYGVVGYWTGGKENHKDERWLLHAADAELISLAPQLAQKRIEAEEVLVRALEWVSSHGKYAHPDNVLAVVNEALEKWRKTE